MHAVDAGRLAPRRRTSPTPMPRSDWRSPSARPACVVVLAGTRAPCRARPSGPTPCFSARSPERWITGPSAIGSENGTPSSITSAPRSTSACISGTVSEGCGSPAVMYGISALRFACAQRLEAARDARHQSSMPDALGDGVHVLVAAAGEIDQQDRVLRHRRRHLHRLRQRVADSSAGMMPSMRHSVVERLRAPRRR